VQRLAAAGWEAFLVGEILLRAEEPEEALRELRR
jgi:indole-3-glycerol phosphate synthase